MAVDSRLFDIISLDLGNNDMLGFLHVFEGKALISTCPKNIIQTNTIETNTYKLAIKNHVWPINIFVRRLEHMIYRNDYKNSNYSKKFKEISNVSTIIRAIGANVLALTSISDIEKYLPVISTYTAIILTLDEVGDLGRGSIIDYTTHYIFAQGKLIELLDKLTDILPRTIYDEFTRTNITEFINDMYYTDNILEKINILKKATELLSDIDVPTINYIHNNWSPIS